MFALLLVLVVVLVGLTVWGSRRALSRDAARVSDGASIRRFFTYLLLFSLLMLWATGLAALLGRVVDVGRPGELSGESLAQSTAYVLVGLPLYAVVAAWTRARMQADPEESRSRGWTLYVTAASFVALVATVLAIQGTITWALGAPGDDGPQFGEMVVWGTVWLAHRWVEHRLVGGRVLTRAGFLGAVLGLGVTSVGAVMALGHVVGSLVSVPVAETTEGPSLLQTGVATLVSGLVAWVVSWVLPSARLQRSTLWHVYVLIFGVAGGLLTAVVGASVSLDRVVLWLLRGTSAGSSSADLEGLPVALAAVVVGGAVWLYHRTVLRLSEEHGRTEVRRAYDYLLAGVGLVAAAVGVMMLVVAGLEALLAASVSPAEEADALGTVVAAATLLVVGAPVWWLFWRRVSTAVEADPVGERRSRTRRAYVFLLFGIAALAAVVALLTGVVTVLQDVFASLLGAQTLYAVRYPIGVLVTAALVAGYHWTVLRADRAVLAGEEHGPRYVLLVGPPDPDVAQVLHRRTGGSVSLLTRTDTPPTSWPMEELEQLLAAIPDAAGVVVLADDRGLHAIPVSAP
ncbi:hypothetical protein GCM10009817_06370 [Terrabacter lapilli]|uniref:DUF5671 domain-containing protein n=1 Tax=Terrabacter lapilli TaxID=436231 RepID=A0ABN2RHG1_9MICO|nr:DUF5671 domain-containing protein [Terrabacter sp.]